MRTTRIPVRAALLAVIALALPAALAAQVPQTIAVDGVNDFNPANLLDADGGDTQFSQVDIGDFYVTNDAVKLYVGFEHENGNFGSVQLGIAIDVGTAAGGTSDPWGRQLEWSLAANKPDFMFYVNLDNNWQGGLYWNGTAWANLSAPGTGALGWIAGNGFAEIGVLLASLGVAPGANINVEAWVTQDSPTKGPLDAAANDASQLSTPGSTTWDTPIDIPMFDYLAFTVMNAADNDAPTLTGAQHINTGVVDVTFSEPVGLATSQVPGNYLVTGATVNAAARDALNLNVVHLTLAADIGASATMYTVTVSNVQDLAGNPIVAGSTTCFALKNVVFRGRMSQFLTTQTPPYGDFTVEGGTLPLTWSLCDGTNGIDQGGDVYEVAADFCLPGNCGAGTATANLEWKWVYDCVTYEPIAGNRNHVMDLATGAQDVLDVWWNDQDPTQFTTHAIDVLLYVDLNVYGYAPGDLVAVNGSDAPLDYTVPSINLLADDGVTPDAAAGDGIYSTVVTFPAGSRKNVTYKFLLNDAYECFAQGDRGVFLNDELFDIVGGALGPLAMPVVHYDRCSTTWRPVNVVFRVDANVGQTPVGPGDVVTVNGTTSNVAPPSFSWDIPSLNVMLDNGVAPDATAGDGIYTTSVVFADSSQIFTEYKYLVNDVYECTDQANRSFTVDADNYSLASPQVLPLDVLHFCETTAAPDLTPSRLALEQNRPNPFNPQTEIAFTVHRAGPASLRVYDLKGGLVRSLHEGRLEEGPHAMTWDGRDATGQLSPAGVYFYRLELNGEVGVRKMMLVK
ncbi:MAG: Ig-like domain-containing protein [bacterium]|nr:Ig-like domain-containing protein [bacterium]